MEETMGSCWLLAEESEGTVENAGAANGLFTVFEKADPKGERRSNILAV